MKMIKKLLADLKGLLVQGYEYFIKLTPCERYLMEKVRNYTLSTEAYRSYKEETEGNEFNTYLETQRKLLRNIILGKRLDTVSDEEVEYFQYGNLRIGINNRFYEVFYAGVDKDFENEGNVSDEKKRLVEKMLLD